MSNLTITPCSLPPECEALRHEVRAFLAEHLHLHQFAPPETFSPYDPEFSRKLGARGWLGMTWPKRYGGHERSYLERFVVSEELLAAGAPVGAHWIADRQSGPQIIRYGTERMRETLLPRIARGELYFAVGMSEPDSGSDLASVRTRAVKVADGWVLNGRKIWNTARHAHYMICLARTRTDEKERHAGLSQFLFDLKTPGITVRPLLNLTRNEGFSEVLFEDVLLPDDSLLGREGDGWSQVTAELGVERAGPERFLSSIRLLMAMIDEADPNNTHQVTEIGKLVGEAVTLRQMSLGLSGMFVRGEDPGVAAALVKELGTTFEQKVPDIATEMFGTEIGDLDTPFGKELTRVTMFSPAYSLRGGSREVLKGMIARKLGLR